ncbi:MAG: hypothetical protein AAGD25_04070 [Cyanobacteria bacterium P01_F01_bin.150]
MAHSTPEESSKPPKSVKGHASQSPLALWVEQHERQLGLSIKGRFRGNSLHLLCEFPYVSATVPSQTVVYRHFQQSVDYAALNRLIPPGYPRIRHMWLYGRLRGAKKPAWTVSIHLNAVQRKGPLVKSPSGVPSSIEAPPMGTLPEASPCEFSSEPIQANGLQNSQKGELPTSSNITEEDTDAATVKKSDGLPSLPRQQVNQQTQSQVESTNFQGNKVHSLPQHVENTGDLYSQAEQGQPNAIAYYLRDVLLELGVEASIRVKLQHHRPNTTKNRLWVTCCGPYSPAAALVGDPIARQLRALSLHNVEDALLQFQVRGEDVPDWVLRIDLTPQEDMLRSWAEWGDVEAISRLANQVLRPLSGQLVEATLKDITLHLSCTSLAHNIVPDTEESLDSDNTEADAATEQEDSLTPSISDPWADSNGNQGRISPSLDAQKTRNVIAALLTALKPQGIQNVVVYGQQLQATSPDWVEWIDISQEMDRTASPIKLAGNGDLDAIAFLIQRVLNTDLNEQLATGGRRVQLLLKKRLLHIMCDAPLCPEEEVVVPEVTRLLRSLNVPGVEGLRIYGRRAGQRRPRWTEVIDFVQQPQLVPEPAPQFAATDAYVTELVTTPSEPIIRADLTASDLWERLRTWQRRRIQTARRFVLSSQLVVPTADSPELMLRSAPNTARVKTALVWTAVGALALVQTDLGLHQLSKLEISRAAIKPREESISQVAEALDSTLDKSSGSAEEAENGGTNDDIDSHNSDVPDLLPDGLTDGLTGDQSQDEVLNSLSFGPNGDNSDLRQPAYQAQAESEIFDSSGFTTTASNDLANGLSNESDNGFSDVSSAVASPTVSAGTSPVETVAAVLDSPYPSFNSEQLDFKLALYHQRVLEVGPPDILVLGSSRALRGIDPAILEEALAELGYADADVFNFGINGATAQVVELIVEQILLPEQLPKLIVWADGARAFNSGRDDRTFNGILASEGYEQLLSGPLLLSTPSGAPSDLLTTDGPRTSQSQVRLRNIATLSQSLSDSYQTLDEDLSDTLAQVSTSHSQRDRIKGMLQHVLTTWLPRPKRNSEEIIAIETDVSDGLALLDNDSLSTSPSQVQGADTLSLDASTSFRALENIDDDGFLPLQIRFDPTQYYQSYARVAGNYDRDYSNFRVEGLQGNALTTLLTASRVYDIPIVFINMPLTAEYLDPFRMGHEQTFRQYMLNLALQDKNFIFRDLSELWLDNAEHRSYFSDPSHLNQYGAEEISQHISEDPMIPWDVTTR